MVDNRIVLGEAVFGTMHGLFAAGSAALAGIQNSPKVFELRHLNPRLDLVPELQTRTLFRRAVRTSEGDYLDLIGVAQAATDNGGRRGFFGYCVAVEYGKIQRYRDAFEKVAEAYKDALVYYLDGDRFRDINKHIVDSTGDDLQTRKLEYVRVDSQAYPIILLKNWRDLEDKKIVFDAIGAAVEWGSEAAPTIVVVEHPRMGAKTISLALIDDFKKKTQERNKERARQKELERQAIERRRAEEQIVTFEKFRRLEERVKRLEDLLHLSEYSERYYHENRKYDELRYKHGNDDYEEDSSRIILMASLIAAGLLIFLIGVLLYKYLWIRG